MVRAPGELLHRLAGGERVNDQVDWENVIEEVESLGREQLLAVQSLLRQALIHNAEGRGLAAVARCAQLAG